MSGERAVMLLMFFAKNMGGVQLQLASLIQIWYATQGNTHVSSWTQTNLKVF